MDLPLFGWGYGPAHFPHLLSPGSPSLMCFRATRCIYVYCETGTSSWVHGDTFGGASICAPRVFIPLLLVVMELCIGDRLFYTKSTWFGYPRKWVAFCTTDMWSWSMIKVVCGSLIMDAPWTPSLLVSLVSSLHHHPHQFLQLTSLWKFLWTPLLMEATLAVTPRHNGHHIPHPAASLGNGELGDGLWESHNKSNAQSTRKANTPPKYASQHHRRHVNCGSHGTNMLYLDCQLDPVRPTEHLRGTRESEKRKILTHFSGILVFSRDQNGPS